MSENEPWTVGRLLTWTTDYLRQHGAENPRLDAEVLLAFARGCERIELYTAFTEIVDDDVRAKFRSLIKERANGKPVAYLVEEKEFFSLPFRVTPAVLIPRPETEFLVTSALDLLKQFEASDRFSSVVDVGTGSGAIAIAIAVHSPSCLMTAVDISGEALEVARENAQTHRVLDRIQFVEGDLLSHFGEASEEPRWDLIVSNPPYISEPERASLPRDVVEHEPAVALFSGPTGLEVTERLVQQAEQQLRPGGWILLEISALLSKEVLRIFETSQAWENIALDKDYSQLPRVVRAKRRS